MQTNKQTTHFIFFAQRDCWLDTLFIAPAASLLGRDGRCFAGLETRLPRPFGWLLFLFIFHQIKTLKTKQKKRWGCEITWCAYDCATAARKCQLQVTPASQLKSWWIEHLFVCVSCWLASLLFKHAPALHTWPRSGALITMSTRRGGDEHFWLDFLFCFFFLIYRRESKLLRGFW